MNKPDIEIQEMKAFWDKMNELDAIWKTIPFRNDDDNDEFEQGMGRIFANALALELRERKDKTMWNALLELSEQDE